jgi:hypothetical protein
MSNGLNFNSIMSIAEIALAAETGGASMALGEAAQQAFQQVATQALSSALQSSGSSGDNSDIINAFTSGFGAATGSSGSSDLASQLLDSSYQNGGLASSQSNLAQAMEQYIASMGAQQSQGSSNGQGQSWLVALAKALGSVLGQEAQQISDLSQKLPGESGNANQFNEDLTTLQGESQQYGILANSISDTLKSLGQGMQGLASKN